LLVAGPCWLLVGAVPGTSTIPAAGERDVPRAQPEPSRQRRLLDASHSPYRSPRTDVIDTVPLALSALCSLERETYYVRG